MNRTFAVTRGSMLVALLGTLVVGCASLQPTTQPPAESVEGNWLNPKGVAVSRFSAGNFVTVERRSGRKLAAGTYSQVGDQLEISMHSFVRRKRLQVRCRMAGPDQLQCVNQHGQSFQLTKAAQRDRVRSLPKKGA